MLTKVVGGCLISLGISFIPASPAPTNQLCYNSQAYRDTHEQECVIDQVIPPGSPDYDPPGSNGPHRGLIGGLLHGLTGGLL